MIYDIAIIGGGIAGLALSIDLKKRGYTIVVIEKGNYPRHKVCGEYISMESEAYLYTLCPSLSLINLPIIRKFKLTSGNSEFSTSLDLGGFGISRYLLEELLYKEALKQGVVFKLNTKAYETVIEDKNHLVRTNNEVINSLLVCNSSGRKSNFETKQKSKETQTINYIGVKYHIKLQRDPQLIEIHNFAGGYCGISNIEDDKTCLCYIVNSSYLKNKNSSITTLEKEILFKNKQLEQTFTNAEFIFKEPLTISGINFRIKKITDENCFFLGDSAGSVSPITGNGMSMGLKSAWALAKEIDFYFSNKTSKKQLAENYHQFWNREFSTRIKLSRHFQKLAEYTSLTRMTIATFNAAPFLANVIIKQTHGKPF